MMLSSPLQTSSSTIMDDRFLRTYLQQNSTWNLEESEHIDHLNSSSNSNGDKLLNNSIHFPSEMRSINLNEMVSNIVDENNEYQSYELLPMFMQHYQTTWNNNKQIDQHINYSQQVKNIPSQQLKFNSSLLSESGYPRNIPDTCSSHLNPPKDIQVLIRKIDHTGINSLIRNVSLQQFRQMIGLQRSSGLTTINDRKIRYHSSSLPLSNIRLINSIKQQENKKFNQQQIFSKQLSSFDTINDSYQEISYSRSNRRTGVANTLHIAIEKCYEQLSYIRDSYAETESKIGLQILPKSSSILDITNTNLLNLSNNPSRVDRLITEYYYEYNRIIHLHERIQEDLSTQDIEATRQTLDEWLNAINQVLDRRRQEIDNGNEKCRSDEKDVLQLAESLRILRITTRKIRTVLWYWLYWSTNSSTNKISLIARHQNDSNQSYLYNGIYYNDLFNIPESNEEQMIYLKKESLLVNENNKENQYNE